MRPTSIVSVLVSVLVGSVGCSGSETSGAPGEGDAGADASITDGSSAEGGSDGAPSDSDAPPVDAGPPIEPGDPGASDVRLDVRSDRAVRPISPLIYGINGGKDAAKNRPTILRSGGNRLTAYNWENNASNAGSDWCFQNDGMLSDSNVAGAAVDAFLDEARAAKAAALITVPIVDHVAADKLGGGGPPDCPNDVRKSGAGYLTTRFRKNRPAKGSALAYPPNTGDDSVYQDELVSWVKGVAGDVPVFFSLDNEPDLWADTHAEVHPAKVGYDELVKRNVDFATAIKAVWPEAKVNGFVSYGWAGYTTLQDAPDRAGKGEFLDYYLGKMKEAEAAAGKRLIDYLDLHWYPEAYGAVRVTAANADAATAKARVQAPRSLWDETFVDGSDWISRDALGDQAIRLIPRIKEKIAAHYPGTKLAITEWHFGGGGHASGAVATADVLGIFGREGVDMAQIWWHNPDDSFTEAGLQAYRSYDGAGAAFGDTSIEAKSSSAALASIYASIEAANPSRLVLVVINKDEAPKTAGIRLWHPTSFTKAKVWTITQSGGAKLSPAADLAAVATNAFSYAMPGWSVSVIVPSP